jgi:hypothetical protein
MEALIASATALGFRLKQGGTAAGLCAITPIAEANLRHGRRFAEAIGKLAKTDNVDAGVLARFERCLGTLNSFRAH